MTSQIEETLVEVEKAKVAANKVFEEAIQKKTQSYLFKRSKKKLTF